MKLSYKSQVRIGFLWTKYKFLNVFGFYLKSLLNDPKQKKSLKSILNTDKKQLIEIYENKKRNILSQILSVKKGSNVFFPLLDGGAGDIAYRFIYLKEIFYYLSCKKCNIYIISQEKFSDIINLIGQYFEITHIKSENDKNIADDVLLQLKKIVINKKGIIINHYIDFGGFPNQKLFYKTADANYNMFGVSQDFSNYLNKNLNGGKKIFLKRMAYPFDKNKIKNIKGITNVILCNYESKTFNMPSFDKIDFKTYLKKTYEIGKERQRKIIINSVYNKEKNIENERLSVKSLNFQEVIYLADKKLIDLFISERNGLNDVLYVFYPEIKQIVYYPEGCGFLTKFKKGDLGTDKDYDISLLNLRRIPGGNVIQDYRKNFLKTIDSYIDNFMS